MSRGAEGSIITAVWVGTLGLGAFLGGTALGNGFAEFPFCQFVSVERRAHHLIRFLTSLLKFMCPLMTLEITIT